MYLAIDDTYGPGNTTKSAYVTSSRRTHVGVIFSDLEAVDVRKQIKECLLELKDLVGFIPPEFHFFDIYNRKSPWDKLPKEGNLKLFEFFARIYRIHRWPVFIQTIDTRTLQDHKIEKFEGKIEGLDLSDAADLSLLWLLFKVKSKYRENPSSIHLLIDEGRKKPGTSFGKVLFSDWPAEVVGNYAASSEEPLLQIADFIAFCVNRSTHLPMKEKRTDIDNWFLNLTSGMNVNCDELKVQKFSKTFTVSDFDEVHRKDRIEKGLDSKT